MQSGLGLDPRWVGKHVLMEYKEPGLGGWASFVLGQVIPAIDSQSGSEREQHKRKHKLSILSEAYVTYKVGSRT